LTDFVKLRKELELFKADQRAEYGLGPIERWMIKGLGVTRIQTGKGRKKRGTGSTITYSHPVLKLLRISEYFVVHKMHKKREYIRRINFVKFLYPTLKTIIDLLEQEERRGIDG
jgi:hypothetical protein